jgi:4-amino-4-deoxy-L-arabinose transferase-like glycosyltransferase
LTIHAISIRAARLPQAISNRRFVLGLLFVALLLRLAAVVALRSPAQFHGMQAGADAVEFNALGLNMANGSGYTLHGAPTSFRAPGFSLFLALLYKISYENYRLVYIALCAISTLTCWLVYLLGRELLPERGARIAATFTAFYIPGIYYSTVFVSETLFTTCLAAGLAAFAHYVRRGSLGFLVLAAVALGWAALTRPFAVLLLPPLAAVLLGGSRAWRRRIVPPLVFTAVFCACVLPWTVRNYLVHRQIVLLTTNGGSTFYGGNNDRVTHERPYLGSWLSTVDLPGRAELVRLPDEVAQDRYCWQLGFAWVRTHGKELPLLVFYKFVRFWLPDLASENRAFVVVSSITYLPLLFLLIVAVFRIAKKEAACSLEWAPIHIAMLTAVVTALIFWGSPRFRDGNIPLVAVYAAIPVARRKSEHPASNTVRA